MPLEQELANLVLDDAMPFSVPVVLGEVTSRGIRRQVTREVQRGVTVGQNAEFDSVLVRRGIFPALAYGAELTVDGEARTVLDYQHEGPAWTRLYLEQVAAEPES